MDQTFISGNSIQETNMDLGAVVELLLSLMNSHVFMPVLFWIAAHQIFSSYYWLARDAPPIL